MAKTIKLDDDVRDILARSSITQTSLLLPEQLDPKLYKRVMKAIEAAGGKWDRRAACHRFDRDPREALGLAVAEGEIANTKQVLQSYYTPAPLADRLVAFLDPQPGDHVLEPSCGEGALVLALYRAQPYLLVHGIDVDEVALARAEAAVTGVSDGRASFTRADFLTMSSAVSYTAVAMNPPFAGNSDIAHVRHAYDMLAPGGRLVAITSPGWTRDARLRVRKSFKAWLESLDVQVESIEAGAFASSGTMVESVMLRIVKPGGARRG